MSVTARKKKLMEKEQKRIEKDGGKVILVTGCVDCPFNQYAGGDDCCYLTSANTTYKEDQFIAFQKCPLRENKVIISIKE